MNDAADVIQHCLNLVPVPALGSSFTVLRFIWTSVQQVKASQRQLITLTQTIAHLLQTLNTEYQTGRVAHVASSGPLDDLSK